MLTVEVMQRGKTEAGELDSNAHAQHLHCLDDVLSIYSAFNPAMTYVPSVASPLIFDNHPAVSAELNVVVAQLGRRLGYDGGARLRSSPARSRGHGRWWPRW